MQIEQEKNKPDNTSLGLCFFGQSALHFSCVSASVTAPEINGVSGAENVTGSLTTKAILGRNDVLLNPLHYPAYVRIQMSYHAYLPR